MLPNGPAIKGVCVGRRSTGQYGCSLASIESRCKLACRLPVGRQGRQGSHGAVFGIMLQLSGLYECRGTSLIGAANLSPVTNLVEGTNAVSQYKADLSKKVIKVYKALLGVVRESGCNNHYKSVLGAGAPACRQAGKQKV